jgi:hypothetical protein
VTKKPSNNEKMVAGGIMNTTVNKEMDEEHIILKKSDMNVGSSSASI